MFYGNNNYRNVISYFILLTLYYTSEWKLAVCIKVKDVKVPRYAKLKDTVTFGCEFDLEGIGLYSLKWYKDDYEFYRFMPENWPHVQTFPVPGVKLNNAKSNLTVITLTDVQFNSSGAYKCEVSSDTPSFQTVLITKEMTVYDWPEPAPNIYGIRRNYAIGEYITGNCTVHRSNPATHLVWYINGDEAQKDFVNTYTPYLSDEFEQMYTSVVGIRFVLEEHYFRKNKKDLQLLCKATIAGLPAKVQSVIIELNNNIHNQRLSIGGLKNFGSNFKSRFQWTVIGFVVILIFY